MALNESFRGGGDSGDAARAAEYLDRVSSHPAVRAYKGVTFDLALADAPGSVLDVGCGLGDDVRALAERAGDGVRVVGVDVNPDFLAEARRRPGPPSGRVEFVEGAVDGPLPFPDGAFAAVRSDRVLQHLDEPGALIDEMCRVTSPGGRLVMSEPDWGALSVAGLDSAQQMAVTALATSSFASPTVARDLEAELRSRGVVDVEARRDSFVITSLAEAQALLSIDELLQSPTGAAAGASVLDGLGQLERAGSLAIEMVGYIVAGRRA